MATTPNLLADHIEASSQQKEVVVNEALDIFDNSIAGILSKAVSGASTTLSTAESRYAIIKFTGTLTQNHVVTIPSRSKYYTFHNSTSGAFTLTVKTSAGSGLVIVTGTKIFLYCDGLDVHVLSNSQFTLPLSLVDSQFIITGSADATKQVRFEVDGITAGQTRVVTIPDANIVMAGSATALTSGRIPFVTTGGLLTDSANLSYSSQNVKLAGSLPGFQLLPAGMAHGVTNKVVSDVAVWDTVYDNNGGRYMIGIRQTATSGVPAFYMDAVLPASPNSNQPAIILEGAKASGTSVAALSNSEILWRLNNATNQILNIYGGGEIRQRLNDAAAVGYSIRAAAAQSGDLFQLQNSSAVALTAFGASGELRVFAGFADGVHIVVGTSTGTKIGTATSQKLGFYNATPIVQPSAYTQTYATADKTHANFTSADIGAFTGGSIGFLDATERDNIRTQFNALRADVADLKQLVNSIIDDLQALGLVG